MNPLSNNIALFLFQVISGRRGYYGNVKQGYSISQNLLSNSMLPIYTLPTINPGNTSDGGYISGSMPTYIPPVITTTDSVPTEVPTYTTNDTVPTSDAATTTNSAPTDLPVYTTTDSAPTEISIYTTANSTPTSDSEPSEIPYNTYKTPAGTTDIQPNSVPTTIPPDNNSTVPATYSSSGPEPSSPYGNDGSLSSYGGHSGHAYEHGHGHGSSSGIGQGSGSRGPSGYEQGSSQGGSGYGSLFGHDGLLGLLGGSYSQSSELGY